MSDPSHDPWLRAARAIVADHVGRATVEVLASTAVHAVLLVRSPDALLVLKVAPTDARPALDYGRSATAQRLAHAAGVPVGAVVATGEVSAVQFLLQEQVDGVEWRRVRTLLRPAEVAAASADIARAVLAIQSVALPSFGALDDPAAPPLVDALRARIALRIPEGPRRSTAQDVLERHADLFAGPVRPTLTHDDLHHANLLFRSGPSGWSLAGVLDWDKAWAGPAESDVARMAFWDDMTDAAFWRVYRAEMPASDGWEQRAMVHQLLWCLEYVVDTARHRQDSATLVARLR